MTEKDLDIAIEKCERIMEFDTRTLKNPESENGWIFEKVYDLLMFLRQFQFATDTNVGDTISRQAAIDAFAPYAEYESNRTNAEWVRRINMVLSALPPSQPEYEPVKAEDFAKTMSENTLYSFIAWHGEALELMERQGFVICKKTM